MNIKEFRTVMDTALRDEGLEERQLLPKRPKVWCLPETDIIRFFHPNAYRRPWGFVLSGGIGIEIPALRAWLRAHKPGEQVGIFALNFVGYSIANEDVLGEFMIEQDQLIPADLWAGLLKDRLLRIPPSLDDLMRVYQREREVLGWLAHPHERHAWDFLTKWLEHPVPSLHVPRRMPDWSVE